MQSTKSILWSYGISGDLPIVFVVIKKYEDIDVIYQMIKAHEYWRTKGVLVDLVVVSQEEIGYNHPLWNSIYEVVAGSHLANFQNTYGGIFLLRGEILDKEAFSEIEKVSCIVSRDGSFRLPEGLIPPDRRSARAEEKYQSVLKKRDLQFFNGIGGFDEKSLEYVIYPSLNSYTPLPWSNVLANECFGCITTEAGGGYTWAFNSREFRITPWSNDFVSDTQGEYIFLEDKDDGERFSAYLLPFEAPGEYEVSCGLGYSKYFAMVSGFVLELIVFVPRKDTVKISWLRIKNNSGKKRSLRIGYYINPVLSFSNNFREKSVGVKFKENTVFIENKFEKEFSDKKVFVRNSTSCSFEEKSTGFVLYSGIDLEANEEAERCLLLGVGDDTEKFLSVGAVRDEFERVKEFYRRDLLKIRVNTPSKQTNLLLNNFLLYQALVCRVWARSSFYQSGGATGFRDQLQDVMPFAYILPGIARKQILHHAKHQFEEGDVLHWWHEEAQKGTRTKFSDDLLWLVYVTNYYLKVTEDYGVLDEQVPFIMGPELQEFEYEKYIEFDFSENSASLFAHCIFAIEHALKFGEHNLILMGSGDWNDGMNKIGEQGKGESVWLSCFVYKILSDFSHVCRGRGREDLADKYAQVAGKLKHAINAEAWDGEWYRRAFFDDGTPLGSIENDECKIDSISQSWSVISGVGEMDKARKAMASLENYLIDRENGIIKLLTPPYSKTELNPGYIKSYPEGVRENGGQYTHAGIWVGIAYAMLKNGNKCFEIFDMLNPINHSRTDSEMRKYKLEPYVIAADIYANPLHMGRGGWSWYTGAASWMYRFGIEFLLGFNVRGNIATVEPCVPDDWKEFDLEYRFNETLYRIKVRFGREKKVVVDNVQEEGNSFRLIDDGNVHFVEVVA